MNTLVIVLIAAVCLAAAYALYGRWLAKTWGIDPKAVTPAHRFQDGKDYVPTDGWTVFSHQFSSIAGAGPVTGAIQAAAFGWLPVLLWILIGGIFFGAVTDFGALYASVKNDGKSMGLLIEKYIGKFGRKVFLLFCWLFTLLVIAAFADMVAGTFNAYVVVDGVTQLSAAAKPNGAAGCISLFFIVFAMLLGLVQKKFHFTGWKEIVAGLVCTVAALALGMLLPITLGKEAWLYITFVYIFFAATLPMWLLKQPRDFMTTFMFVGMIAGAVLGLLVAHPSMNLPVYTWALCSPYFSSPSPAAPSPASTAWSLPAPPPRRWTMKRICSRSVTAPWSPRACWLCWPSALPVPPLLPMVPPPQALPSRSSPTALPVSWKCSVFPSMWLSAS